MWNISVKLFLITYDKFKIINRVNLSYVFNIVPYGI